jgi:hypothetical protein
VVSSRGAAARVAGSAGNPSRGGFAATQRLALSVRQDLAGQPAETDPLNGPYLNTALDAER